MHNIFKKFVRLYHNLPMRNKLIFILLLISVLPMFVPAIIYNTSIKGILMDRFENALEKNYNLIFFGVQEQMNKTEDIAKMLSINKIIGKALDSGIRNMKLNNEIHHFNEIGSLFDTVTDSSTIEWIRLYIDDSYSMAGTTPGTRFRTLDMMEIEGWGSEFKNSNEKKIWAVWHEMAPFQNTSYLTYFQALWDVDDYRKMVGVLALGLDMKAISSLLVGNYDEQIICICSKDTVYASNDGEFSLRGKKLNLSVTGMAFDKFTLEDKEYIYLYNRISNSELYLLSACPKDILTSEISKMLHFVTKIFIVLIGAVICIIYKVSKSFSNRFDVLLEGMKSVYKGELFLLTDELYKDEIGQLTTGYNFMIQNIKNLLKEHKKLGEEIKGAELLALQSQINPHFLYNTLDMINWMASRDQTDKIKETVRLLSRYYKLALSKGQNIVTLDHEIHLCISYLEIQFLRFRGKIQFIENIQEEVKGFLIPKIIIQPLIENAIFYGINTKPEGRGMIWLNGFLEGDSILIEIIDDGMGYDTSLPYVPKGEGSNYGIANIRKRLNMFYQREDCLSIVSTVGFGTKVTIKIPKITEEDGKLVTVDGGK